MSLDIFNSIFEMFFFFVEGVLLYLCHSRLNACVGTLYFN